MEPSSWRIYSIKNWQKWIRDKKIMPPKVGESFLLKNKLIKQFVAYFQTPQKILKYYFITFRITRRFVKLKMVISKQFKSLNLNKKMRKLVFTTHEVVAHGTCLLTQHTFI
jgi:hypothetical protein